MADRQIALRAGPFGAELRPEVGGSIGRFWIARAGRRLHLLRPASEAALAAADSGGMACFPLVPYSNRIRAGRFPFGGRTVQLPLNFGDHPHSIHGHGWHAPWRVASVAEASATLVYEHAADAWPWPYIAEQTFTLSADGLSVALSVENRAAGPMPAGLGFHPYFPRSAETRLTTQVERVWLTDAEVMPTERVTPPADWTLGTGFPADRIAIDNGFTGWGHRAEITLPGQALTAVLSGGEGLDFLVVYTPAGEDFLCVEPVSHCTDAFNRAAQGDGDTGMRVLAPGERWGVEMRIGVREA